MTETARTLGGDRNLLYVVIARFISRVGGTAVWFIGTWGTAAYVFKASAGQLAGMSALNGVAAIVGSLVAGVLIDRFGPRKVMIIAELCSIPPVLWMMVAPSFPLFIIGSAIFSLFGVPTFTAGASFAPYLYDDRTHLERANAFIEGGSALGFVLGPALGALVSKAFGMRPVFFIMVAASLIAAVAAYLTRIDESPRPHVSGNAFADVGDGLRMAYTTRSIRYAILMGTVVWFGFGAFSALETLFYRDVVGVGVEWFGWMNTALGVGLICGAALLPRLPDRVVSARGLGVFTALVGVGIFLYVGSTDLRFIAVGAFFLGLFIGGLEPLLRTLLHLDSPHEYVGRIVGTAQWHRSAGELIPLAFVPALAAIVGIQETLLAGGVFVVVLALLGLRTAAGIDRERSVSSSAELAGTPLPEEN